MTQQDHRRHAADFPLSDYDFMELVMFSAKVESEGFEYASENYRPTFQDEALADWIGDYGYDRLRALSAMHEQRLAAFWDSDDADERYDAHLDQERARDKAARGAVDATAATRQDADR